MNLARLALRTVLFGRPRAWVAMLAAALVTAALGCGADRVPALAILACVMAAHTVVQTLARRRELASLRALGMRRTVLVLMLELEILWITCLGALPGVGAALLVSGTMPALHEAAEVMCAGLLAALVPAIRAALGDVAQGLALLPARQEG